MSRSFNKSSMSSVSFLSSIRYQNEYSQELREHNIFWNSKIIGQMNLLNTQEERKELQEQVIKNLKEKFSMHINSLLNNFIREITYSKVRGNPNL